MMISLVYGLALEVLPNQQPSITIISPPSGTKTILTDGYYIVWEDDDPDNDATIELYYDTDNKGYNGVLINESESISEDTVRDAYYWLVGDIPSATYYIYAKIYDGITEPYYSYSNGTVIIPAVKSPVKVGAYYMNGYGDFRSLSGNYGFDVSELQYFGWDIYVDFEVSSDGKVCYAYDGFGGVYAAGKSPFSVDSAVYFGWDIARDLEITPDNLGLYLLDGYGIIHTVGQTRPWAGLNFGWDIARDLEIPPDGQGGYILDGYGGIYSLDGAQRLKSTYFGWDIARSLKVLTDGGYYVLDGYGNTHEFDNAPEMDDLEFGYDIARDLEVVEPYTTLVYDANGGIHFATENVRLFWNNYVLDATEGIAKDLELSTEMVIPTPTVTPTPGPEITPTASMFQAVLNDFADAYKNEDGDALFGTLVGGLSNGVLSPNYSDENHKTLESLYNDLVYEIDLLPEDIADNNNEITLFTVEITKDSVMDVSDTTAEISNVQVIITKFERQDYPGFLISPAERLDCDVPIDPEDPNVGSDGYFELKVNDNVILRDFGDGLFTRLYILRYVDINEWEVKKEYYYRNSGEERATFNLQGNMDDAGVGIGYKILHVSSDCADAYEPPEPYIAYLEIAQDETKSTGTWKFENIGGTWYISSSEYLQDFQGPEIK